MENLIAQKTSPSKAPLCEGLLDRSVVANLAAPTPVRLLRAVATEWTLIVGTIAASVWMNHAALTVLAVAFIATRQHALSILMHEFSHRHFSRSRPRLNDVLGDVLTALPIFVTIHGFRRDHALHHAHTGTDGDPNWALSQGKDRYTFPKSRARTLWIVLKHCIGAYTWNDVKGYLVDSKMAVGVPRATWLRQACFMTAAIGLTTYLQAWPIIATYWILPFFTGMLALLYWREVGEHFGLSGQHKAPTRTMLLNRLEAWLIAPYNVHFHAEHHLHPNVPAFCLPRLHRLLQKQPAFVARTVFTRGYLGLLRELSGRA